MVVAILAILIGLLVPAIGWALRSSRTAATRALLGNVSVALTVYLGDHGILGDDRADAAAPDFCARPLEYLLARPVRAARPPYLQPQRRQMRTGDGAQAEPATAAVLIDAFARPVRFRVENRRAPGRTAGGYDFTGEVAVWSDVGTATPDDDIGLRYRHGNGEWTSTGR